VTHVTECFTYVTHVLYITGLKLKFLKFCKVEKMIYFIEKIILKHKKINYFDNKI